MQILTCQFGFNIPISDLDGFVYFNYLMDVCFQYFFSLDLTSFIKQGFRFCLKTIYQSIVAHCKLQPKSKIKANTGLSISICRPIPHKLVNKQNL